MKRPKDCQSCGEPYAAGDGATAGEYCARCRIDRREILAVAREMYENNDENDNSASVTIPPRARLERTTDGTWVQAWAFVPNPE